ncbi:MAG: hypothetical protein S4CHLAM123_11550 [Chlamydiales bacterium]|nr:hypothetical protein [Chlamydiales bacterium]
MPSIIHPVVIHDLIKHAKELRATRDWKAFRPGVCAHWLYQESGTGASAVLLRYEAGARVQLHEHMGYEHMFVLEGDQFDENGTYPEGSFVIHPPGSQHSPGSIGGCVALLIYEKKVRFLEQ